MSKQAIKRNPLVTKSEYEGEYVAFEGAESKKIVAHGSNPATVIKNARNQGIDVPAIVFVPKKDVTYIY